MGGAIQRKADIEREIKKAITKVTAFKCTPDKIRTCNRLIRSQVLYPVELRVQIIESIKDKNIITAGQLFYETKKYMVIWVGSNLTAQN